jgi:hypothetical protein
MIVRRANGCVLQNIKWIRLVEVGEELTVVWLSGGSGRGPKLSLVFTALYSCAALCFRLLKSSAVTNSIKDATRLTVSKIRWGQSRRCDIAINHLAPPAISVL